MKFFALVFAFVQLASYQAYAQRPVLISNGQIVSPGPCGCGPQVIGAPPQVIGAPPQFIAAPPQVIAAPPQVIAAPPQVIAAPPQVIAAPQQLIAAPQQLISPVMFQPNSVANSLADTLSLLTVSSLLADSLPLSYAPNLVTLPAMPSYSPCGCGQNYYYL